ncbi:Oidioi.mRNA.OKI2018_I69.chr1.g632.t1.cds [Oikopleura dioica]|uniref:Hexosyltransferase n=1 Tax=Oikopleura dioica TaxID=34765 RepID=A0ABN7SM64_OIKDI|nr:Oidioi.mRNA.OKI2018_I69.chr1.g632.t1.cds [Oikopleura dioica]
MFYYFGNQKKGAARDIYSFENECNQSIDQNIPRLEMMEEQEMTEEEEIIENDFEDLDKEVKKLKSCKTFEALPENWKTNESWEVGFIEAPKCPEKELIIIVNTAHKNRGNRLLLRRYFEELEKKQINFAYFFLLGKSETPIENENDWIIGDFDDTYDNLILKTKSSYEYFERFCGSAKFYLLIDDDVAFYPAKIIEKLGEEGAKDTILGKRWNKAKAHNHPWLKEKGITISEDQWAKQFWPDYIAGPCAFMTAESARSMANVAQMTKKLSQSLLKTWLSTESSEKKPAST